MIKETNQRARALFRLRNRPGHQHFFARLIADTDRGEVILAWSSLAGDQPRELAELHFQTLDGDRSCTLGAVSATRRAQRHARRGLIGELTAWVLEQAYRQLILWDQVGFRVPRLAVNLPMREIECTDLVNRVRRTLERTGLAPGELVDDT